MGISWRVNRFKLNPQLRDNLLLLQIWVPKFADKNVLLLNWYKLKNKCIIMVVMILLLTEYTS